MRVLLVNDAVWFVRKVYSLRTACGSEDGRRGKPCNIMIYIRSIFIY